MPHPRVRVRKPISVRGMVILGVIVAMATATSSFVAYLLCLHVAHGFLDSPQTFVLVSTLTVGAILVGPPLLFVILTAAICRRLRDAFVVGASHFVALVVAAVAVRLVMPPFEPIVAEPLERAQDLGVAALWTIIAAPAVGLIAFALAWIVRTFVWEVVDQDGSRCHRCGHELVATASAVCPECGTAVADGTRVGHRAHRLTHWIGQRWRRWALVFAAMAIAFVGWRASIELPFARFERTFAAWERTTQFHLSPTASHLIWASSRSRVEATDGGEDIIQLMLFRRHAAAPPTLRIVVRTFTADATMTAAHRLHLGWSRDCAFVDVPAEARDEILRHGLSEELIESLRAVAARHEAQHGDGSWRRGIEFGWNELTTIRTRDD